MNFLAHLHLAHLAESSLSGNLLADFVRGNPEESFPPDVVAGIHMHRRIDVLTDNLPEVREAREWFRSETRRVAPITLDVMWDHAAVAGLSATGICLLCPRASDDDFAGLTATFYQSEQLLVVRAVAGALSRYGFHPERVKRHGKPPPTSGCPA